MKYLEKRFKLREAGTSIRTEIVAGMTTFMTMAYILVVNPMILASAGMESTKVFAATAIASVLATLVMGLLANLPIGLSAGMGLNAFFAYTVCMRMGYSWQWAITAIFIEGIIFLLLTFFNIREAIVNSIPATLKKAIGAGIGLYIAFIGLQNAGIITGGSTLVELSPDWYRGPSGLAMLGLLITAILMIRKIPGAILIGMIVTTLIGIPLGLTSFGGGSFLGIPCSVLMEEVSRKKVNSRNEMSDIAPVFKPGVFLLLMLVSVFNGVHNQGNDNSQDGAEQA